MRDSLPHHITFPAAVNHRSNVVNPQLTSDVNNFHVDLNGNDPYQFAVTPEEYNSKFVTPLPASDVGQYPYKVAVSHVDLNGNDPYQFAVTPEEYNSKFVTPLPASEVDTSSDPRTNLNHHYNDGDGCDEYQNDTDPYDGDGREYANQNDTNGYDGANQNDTNIFDRLVNGYCKNIIKIPVVPSEAEDFKSEDQFKRYFVKYPQKMRTLLSAYTVGDPNIQTLEDLARFLKVRPSYHTKTYNPNLAKHDFFQTFKHHHFKFTRNDPGSVYEYTVYATEELRTSNLSLHEDYKRNVTNVLSLFGTRGVCTRMKTHLAEEPYFTLVQREPVRPTKFVASAFRFAWQLQSDGDQTNATLQPQSAEYLVDALLSWRDESDNGMFRSEDCIVDFGSSYGSLLLQIVNHIASVGPDIVVRGYGIEYSKQRHILGSYCFKKMLLLLKHLDHIPLRVMDVFLERKNLLEITSLPSHCTHILAFDKAFSGYLLIHNALVAMNSKSVRYFICCKPYFTTSKKTLVSLKGENEDNRSGGGFDVGEMLIYMKFKLLMTTDNLKMNGKGSENSGKFTVYEVPHVKIDEEYVSTLVNDYFAGKGFKNCELDTIASGWKNANANEEESKNTKSDDFSNSCRSNHGVPSYDQILTYYSKEGDYANLSTSVQQKIDDSCLGDDPIACRDEVDCVYCATRFPTERSLDIVLEIKNCDGESHGMGLFLKRGGIIKKGEYICQFPRSEITTVDAKATIARSSCDGNSQVVIVRKQVKCGESVTTRSKSKETVKQLYEEQTWIRAQRDIAGEEEITLEEEITFCIPHSGHKLSNNKKRRKN